MSSIEHVGFIMDGNRRWARRNSISNAAAHSMGYVNLTRLGREVLTTGRARYVSAYIFSVENWGRSEEERRYMIQLFHDIVRHARDHLVPSGIRVRCIGNHMNLPPTLIEEMESLEADSKTGTSGDMCYCISYGGREEIVDAVKAVIARGCDIEELNPELLASGLYAPEIPFPNIIVRTGNAKRLSSYLLWQAAYCDVHYTEKLWPDYTIADLDESISEYVNNRWTGCSEDDNSYIEPACPGQIEDSTLEEVDLAGSRVASVSKLRAHKEPVLHRAFSVLIVDDAAGQLLLQRRSLRKYHWPGTWSNSACGHPTSRENIVKLANERVQFELGITATGLEEFGQCVYKFRDSLSGLWEWEFNHVLVGTAASESVVPFNEDEVARVSWVRPATLKLMVEQEDLSPWFSHVYRVARSNAPHLFTKFSP